MTLDASTILPPLVGGVLIGLASIALMLFNGRIAGISGIVSGTMTPPADERPWRLAFVGGLVAGGALIAARRHVLAPSRVDEPATVSDTLACRVTARS